MRTKVILASLLLLTASAAPAFANYFSDPLWNRSLNIGSAPSPTPEQLRAIGDTNQRVNAFGQVGDENLLSMHGKPVYGRDDQLLGYVVSTDPAKETLMLETPTGVKVWFPADYFVNRPAGVRTQAFARADIQAMSGGRVAYD